MRGSPNETLDALWQVIHAKVRVAENCKRCECVWCFCGGQAQRCGVRVCGIGQMAFMYPNKTIAV